MTDASDRAISRCQSGQAATTNSRWRRSGPSAEEVPWNHASPIRASFVTPTAGLRSSYGDLNGRPGGSLGSILQVSRLKFERRYAKVCRSGASVESLVPHGQNEFRVPDSQGAGQMYCIGAPKAMQPGEVPGLPFNPPRQLDRSGSAPVLLPRLLGCGQIFVVEIVIATSSRKCRAYLGIRQTA
jgi:hypothetical protein